MNKDEIAQILREIGIFIELTDKFPLKGLSYKRAARSVESLTDLEDAIRKKHLETLPGVGKKISSLIQELNQGNLTYYEFLKKKIPSTLYELLSVPGLSPEKVRTVYKTFNVKTLKEFRKLLKNDQKIAGFSPSFREKIKKRVEEIKKKGNCYPFA